MRRKAMFPAIAVALLTVTTLSCYISDNLFERPFDEPVTDTAAAHETETALARRTATATATAMPTPTGTSSANAPRPVPAGKVIVPLTGAGHNPVLAYDAQGQLNLFFQSPTASGGQVYNQSQMNADGSWTAPVAVSPEFQFLVSLSVVPDMSGRQCILWSGEQYDANGNAVDGLYRNCAQAGGAWQAQAEALALTNGPADFSPVRAPDGSLQSVFLTQSHLSGLYYSPIAAQASTALTGTQLSGGQQVLLGRLAIDASGGYHAAWVETDGNTAIVVQERDSEDGGKTWTPAQQLYAGSADNPASISFQMAADATGHVHLAWEADNAIHYSQWSGGAGWAKPIQLSGDGRSSSVALAVSPSGLARAVWSVAASQPSVVLALQAFDGSWAPPSTLSSGRAFETALAVDAKGATHVVWNAGDGLRYVAIP